MKSISIRPAALCAVLAATLLTGCAVAVVGGAAAAGGLMAVDRRSAGTQLSDQSIELRAASRISELLEREGHVSVISYYRKVLLTGEVPTEEGRRQVQVAVEETPEVEGVVNELAVMPKASLSQRSNDTFLTGKVKTGLIDANGVPANSIKVVTARGTTYLMGRLTEREAALATEVARTTSGVQRVVRVIDIISEQAALHPRDAAGSNVDPTPVSSPASNAVQITSEPPAPATQGVVIQPVTQPTVIQQPPIEVRPLPPAE